MKTFLITVLLLTLSFIYAEAGNKGGKKPIREDIEWLDVWVPNTNDTGLPRVLFIGNSITRAYYPEVDALLKGQAYTARLCTSKSIGDPGLLAEIALIMNMTDFDIVHFNNGMHGDGYTEAEYKAAFPDFIKTIRKHAPKAKLVWASTTPVRRGEGMKEFDAKTERIKVRNQIAADYVSGKGIGINDLFGTVADCPEYYANGDGVHPVAPGVTALANQVANVIKETLKK